MHRVGKVGDPQNQILQHCCDIYYQCLLAWSPYLLSSFVTVKKWLLGKSSVLAGVTVYRDDQSVMTNPFLDEVTLRLRWIPLIPQCNSTCFKIGFVQCGWLSLFEQTVTVSPNSGSHNRCRSTQWHWSFLVLLKRQTHESPWICGVEPCLWQNLLQPALLILKLSTSAANNMQTCVVLMLVHWCGNEKT